MTDKKKSAKKAGGKGSSEKTAGKASDKKTAEKAPANGAEKGHKKSKDKTTKQKRLKAYAVTVAVEKAELLSSEVAYDGPLFRVLHDKLIEPGGKHSERDVIRHNGSVVILAIDSSKSKKNPWIVIERQYRHAANQYLWELPAGKLDAGEDALAGAKRELAEETGYAAKKWRPLVEYYASPGFLGESMEVFLAEGLVAGDAHPEDDEQIEFRLVKLSDVLKMIEKGAILDGKTLTSILLYSRIMGRKHKK
jgi:ADP-ribose pyrophosphatase